MFVLVAKSRHLEQTEVVDIIDYYYYYYLVLGSCSSLFVVV